MISWNILSPSRNPKLELGTATKYGLSVLSVVAAFVARYALDDFFGDRSALDLFLVAVAASAWIGGAGPAFLAMVVSLLLGLWFFVPPRESFAMGTFVDRIETASFIFAAATIAIITHVMKRATQRARKSAEVALQRQEDLAEEVERRRRVEEALQALNARLEDRVQERTNELHHAMNLAKKSAEEALLREADLAREVSMRRQAEEELQRVNARLEDRVNERTVELRGALKELEAYAHSIAHNLRAPLRGIAGLSDLIEAEESEHLSPEGKAHLARVRKAMVRMDALIVGLLEYSRVSREEYRHEPIALEDVVEEAVRREHHELTSKNAALTIEKPMPVILGHRPALMEVLTQLLSNALKFVPSDRNPVIRITAKLLEDKVLVTVEDNGIGVEAEYQDRIFGVFERLGHQELVPGTGIGLAIVRKCMERMGGTVGVDSIPGQGSKFWIRARAARLSNGGPLSDRTASCSRPG